LHSRERPRHDDRVPRVQVGQKERRKVFRRQRERRKAFSADTGSAAEAFPADQRERRKASR